MGKIMENRRLAPALSAMSAAVCGAILKVALFFSEGIFFPFQREGDEGLFDLLGAIDTTAILLAVLAGVALIPLKVPMGWVMAAGVFLGLLIH